MVDSSISNVDPFRRVGRDADIMPPPNRLTRRCQPSNAQLAPCPWDEPSRSAMVGGVEDVLPVRPRSDLAPDRPSAWLASATHTRGSTARQRLTPCSQACLRASVNSPTSRSWRREPRKFHHFEQSVRTRQTSDTVTTRSCWIT